MNTNDTNENTASARYDIAEHLDPSGEIHAGSNPAEEFARWQEHAAENPQDWTGNEFTLGDFESYIAEARSQYDAPTLALADYLGENPANITEERGLECGMTIYSVGSREYVVGTDDEADEAWDQALDSYLDDTGLLDSIPENLRNYFDRDAWKRDARHDGRGHALALYDGDELELAGDLFAFRIN
jgi:hypothetical protein